MTVYKITRFILKDEYQILPRSNFSEFYYKLYYFQVGCIVSDT